MSVATKNPFAILEEDTFSDAPAAKPAPQAPLPSARETQKKTGPATRGGRYYPRGGAKPTNNRDAPAAEEAAADTNQKKFDGEGRGRGRGRGGRGGDRGGRGGRGGGNRAYDRHSMTGKT
jgi:plasminogen activator inhibitor 1 RNA-binding protein